MRCKRKRSSHCRRTVVGGYSLRQVFSEADTPKHFSDVTVYFHVLACTNTSPPAAAAAALAAKFMADLMADGDGVVMTKLLALSSVRTPRRSESEAASKYYYGHPKGQGKRNSGQLVADGTLLACFRASLAGTEGA